jgi:hypothetical protein
MERRKNGSMRVTVTMVVETTQTVRDARTTKGTRWDLIGVRFCNSVHGNNLLATVSVLLPSEAGR